MFHLIKKDILMQKALKLSILLMVFFTFTLANIGQVGFLVSVLAVTYQLALGASSLEDKNNSDKILISLPIRKSTIVLSKYASIYVYAAFAILIYYVVYLVNKLVNAPLDISFNLTGILGAAVTVTFVLFDIVSADFQVWLSKIANGQYGDLFRIHIWEDQAYSNF
ncbi:ABC-2 transporter permease [Vibrio hannami]|nr:ABC-2 transporter permease [Vibrio hannami]MDG3086622.1 ABC-2 transporter permease [Vibrio hannami]